MTQAMPPAQAISFDPANAPDASKKSASQEDFSDTLRDQLEGKSQDRSTGSASATNVKAVQEQAVEIDESAAETIVESHKPVGGTEPVLPPGSLSLSTQTGIAIEMDANHALQGQPSEVVNAPQGLAVLADTHSTSAIAAAVVMSTQSRSAVGTSSGAASPVGVAGDGANQAIDLAAGKNQLAAAFGDGASSKELSLHSFTRVAEVVTAAPTQVGATAAPALAAAATGAQGTVSLPSSPSLSLAVETPLANPGWGSAMAARLVWGATQGMQSANIEINPRDLGPVSVKLRMVGDEASITFVSQHALVREAVEAALPRLRELFSGDGVNLGEVDISNGEGRPDSGDDPASAHDMQSHAHADAQADAATTLSPHEDRPHRLDSLVDTFA